MGMFRDHAYCEFEGKYKIEVEARVTGLSAQYSLIVNDRKQDQLSGIIGCFKLRGVLKANEDERLVVVDIKQGLLGTKFFLTIDGKDYPLIKDK